LLINNKKYNQCLIKSLLQDVELPPQNWTQFLGGSFYIKHLKEVKEKDI
jgi:hypothetical protein